jgi:exonuclease SbcD
MPVQFLHLADVHLGYQQYGSAERFNDFGRAFARAVDYALNVPVDFVIITGDLFHKAHIDPRTLLQAVHNLDRLRRADVPVVAVYGNHDQPRYQQGISWLEYLTERGHLVLLSPSFSSDQLELEPWDGFAGAFVDLGATRIVGIPYLGASQHAVIAELPKALSKLEKAPFTILMSHAGVEGEMPGLAGGLRHAELSPLRPFVDYIALGHLHKPFEREDWIYNPGALEVCGMDERRWRGGFYHVTIDDVAGEKARHSAKHIAGDRRPFHRLTFRVDEYTAPLALYDALRAAVQDAGLLTRSKQAPVVELSLEGVLAFDRSELDVDHIRVIVVDVLSPLVARVRNHTRATEFDISPEEGLNRAELERTVLHELTLRDARYRDHADAWAQTMVEIKSLALAGSTPEAIVDAVRHRMDEMAELVGNGQEDRGADHKA